MRVLFTFAGGSGHAHPLVPIASAASRAGHEVALAGQARTVTTLAREGWRTFVDGRIARGAGPQGALLALDLDREERVLPEHFAGRLARERADALLEVCLEWRPDVVVCDETDFGAMVTAERLGLPHASVVVIAAGSFARPEVVGEPLHELRAEQGLDPDPGLEMLSRYLVLSPVPPSFRDPAYPLPPTGHVLRPTEPGLDPHDRPPRWLDATRSTPLVYVTLGTVFNTESGDLFDRVLTGLRGLPVEVVVTVGRELDPAQLGPQPPSVHLETYVPQALLLRRCDLLLCHGGSGSVLGALAHGVPLVVMPMGADQPANAARCEELGVGRALHAAASTSSDVREAVDAVLTTASYRTATERVRAEIEALPPPEHAIPLLESLVSR